DDRCAQGGCGCLPGACGAKRRRRQEVRTRAPDHPCGEFSTGVARAGNSAAERLENVIFRPFETAGNCTFSFQASPLIPWEAVVGSLLVAGPPDTDCGSPLDSKRRHLRRLLLPAPEPVRARAREAVPD